MKLPEIGQPNLILSLIRKSRKMGNNWFIMEKSENLLVVKSFRSVKLD